jgi:hypothetical protein
MDLGITVYVIEAEQVKPEEREDFVLYDDKYVRYAHPIDNTGTLKVVTLSMDEREVRNYVLRFNALLARGTLASQYLGKK